MLQFLPEHTDCPPMKKNKNSDSTVSEPRIITAPVESAEESGGIPPALLPSGEQYLYFTERDIDRILENLDGLRDRVFPRLHGDEAGDQHDHREVLDEVDGMHVGGPRGVGSGDRAADGLAQRSLTFDFADRRF